MATYLVERYVPTPVVADIEAAVLRLAPVDGHSRSATRHLWTALIAVDETCLSLFEASSADDVAAANRRASFPFDRIMEASLIGAAVGGASLSSTVVARRGSPR